MKNGWTHEVIRDLGSGLNYHKKGLRELLQRIIRNDVERLLRLIERMKEATNNDEDKAAADSTTE